MSAVPEAEQSQPYLKPLTVWQAWRSCLAITLLGCLLLGLGCFIGLGEFLPQRMDLFTAAIWQQVGFGVALGLILVVIVVIQRRRGESLRELGWARPTTWLALILGTVLGGLYLWGCYFGAKYVLPGQNVLAFHWARIALAPLGIFMAIAEETMMRGYFMTELQRARISAWIQILASGACSAVYHALQNPTLEGFLPACVLFSLHAGLYVLGRRSLTPTIMAHSMYHVFGEPYFLMMVMKTAIV
jgi:membrane protease YdiL (CAAX protease family)